MTFKKGDKVEYRGGAWVFDGYNATSNKLCYIANGRLSVCVFIAELKPIKSAHDKLIDMGYECLENNDRIARYQRGNRGEIIFNKLYKYYTFDATFDNVVIKLELAKVIVQYLEEMENTK